MTSTREQVIDRLNTIFRIVFEDETLFIHEEMTAHDVELWDSLTHVTLIVTVESEFKIRFSTEEIGNFNKVGDLIEMVEKKIMI